MGTPTPPEQDLASEFVPVFMSRRGEAEAMRAYQAVLDEWTADYQPDLVNQRILRFFAES